MKYSISLTIALMFVFSVLNGQMKSRETNEEAEVSDLVKKGFDADFGNVPEVQWKNNAGFDQATFTKDDRQMSAFYDPSGKLIGEAEKMDFNDLPVKAQDNINKRYSLYSVGPVIYFDDANHDDSDTGIYGPTFAEEKNYFVLLKKKAENIVLQVSPTGQIIFFSKIK